MMRSYLKSVCVMASFIAIASAADEVRVRSSSAEANSLLYGEGEQGVNSAWASSYTDGRNPHAGADYALYGTSGYLSNGRSMIGGANHKVFIGDSLRLGDIASDASFDLLQRQGGSTYADCSGTINNLILEKGYYHLGAAGAAYCELNGTIFVRSPFSSPFNIYANDTNVSTTHWKFSSSISGDVGTALKFYYWWENRANYSSEFVLAGDNSAYRGKYIVDGINAWLCLADAKAMGENVPLPDAIILQNGGGVGGARGTSASVESQRGITVESTGGTFYAGRRAAFELSVPVVGTGAVRVIGGGKFVFNGDYQAGDITVAPGTTFLLGKNANLHGATVTYEGGKTEEFWLPDVDIVEELDLSETTDPTIVFCNDNELKSGTFKLTGVCATWPLRLKIADGLVRPTADTQFAILQIPTSLKVVTAEDFYFANRTPYSQRHWVVTEGDNQIVYLEFPKVLTASGEGFQWGGGSLPDRWTDGSTTYLYGQSESRGASLYDPNVAYLNTLSVQQRVALPTPFCGTDYRYSLSLSPTVRFCNNFAWKVNSEREIADLRLYGNTYLYPNNGNMTISGGLITVCADETSPAEVVAYVGQDNRRAEIKSKLAGDGVLRVGADDNTTANGACVALQGDNSLFLGTLVHDTRNTGFTSILEISNDNSLGGNLAKPTPNAVRLSGAGNSLRATANIAISAVNRGLSIGPGYVIEVAQDKTLTIESPLRVAGQIVKTGKGILSFSRNLEGEGDAELVVRDGLFLVSPGNAPSGLKLTSAGGAVAMSLPTAGSEAMMPTDRDYEGFSFAFVYGLKTGCVVFTDESLPKTFPLTIEYVLPTRPAAGEKFPIFKIPTSSRVVTKWDFISKGSVPNMEKYTVETVGDMQIVSVEFPEIMNAQDINFQVEKWTVNGLSGTIDIYGKSYPSWWTLGDWPNYACFAKRLGGDGAYRWNKYWGTSFPGDSLSVQGAGAGTSRYYICGKSDSYDIDDFRLYEHMYFRRNGKDATLSGHLLVAGTAGAPSGVQFEQADGTLSLQSDLRGEGFLQVVAGSESSDGKSATPVSGCVLALSGDNSRFIGTLEVKPSVWPMNAASRNDVTVKISADSQLGGNPAALNPKATRILGANALEITDDVVSDSANRGYYFSGAPNVKVATGKTFALNSPVLLAGTLTKKGEGTLRLASVTAETAAPGANVLAVETGSLDLVAPCAVSNIAFNVSEGASMTIRLSRNVVGTLGIVNTVDDTPFGTSGTISLAWADGEGLALEPRTMRKASIPLMTVRATAAESLVMRLVCPKDGAEYSLRTVIDNGLATIYADACMKPGMCLFIR